MRSKEGEKWATFTFEDSEAILANMNLVTVPVDRRGIAGPAQHHKPLQRRADLSLSFPALTAIKIEPTDPNLAADREEKTIDPPPARESNADKPN